MDQQEWMRAAKIRLEQAACAELEARVAPVASEQTSATDETKAPDPLPDVLPAGTKWRFHNHGGIFDEPARRRDAGKTLRWCGQSTWCFDGDTPRRDGRSITSDMVDWPSYYQALHEQKAVAPARPDPYATHRAKLSAKLGVPEGLLLDGAAAAATAQIQLKRLDRMTRAERMRAQALLDFDRPVPNGNVHPSTWPEQFSSSSWEE